MAVKLIIQDEVNIKFVGLPLDVRKALAARFKFQNPAARYSPAFKLGRWDGAVSLFGIGGAGYLNHLEQVLQILQEHKISITDIEDLRKPVNLNFKEVTETYWADQGKCWPEGHQLAGQPIMLRDYQVTAINHFLKNPQALQALATGSGKCRTYDSKLSITIDELTDFGKFIVNRSKLDTTHF